MTIYKKPDLKVFGVNAKPTEIAEFEDLLRGWGITIEKTNGIPPMEWFNYLFNRLDGNINYILQNGITEYDTNLEYPQNAIVKSGGKLYLCLRQNTNKPLSNGTYWELLIKNATTSQKGVVQLSSSVTSTDETKASTPKATKTAYDKAVIAQETAGRKLNANTVTNVDYRTDIKTSTESGGHKVTVKNGESTYFQCRQEEDGVAGRITYRSRSGAIYDINIPRKNGALLIDNDLTDRVDLNDSKKICSAKAVKYANDNANSRLSLKNGGIVKNLVTIETIHPNGDAFCLHNKIGNLTSYIRKKANGTLDIYSNGDTLIFPKKTGTISVDMLWKTIFIGRRRNFKVIFKDNYFNKKIRVYIDYNGRHSYDDVYTPTTTVGREFLAKCSPEKDTFLIYFKTDGKTAQFDGNDLDVLRVDVLELNESAENRNNSSSNISDIARLG